MHRKPELTVLSFGGGQDSTAIAYRLALDPAFRAKYAPGRLLAVMADTGNEHPRTLAHVEFMKGFFRKHGIEFVHLTGDMGFHGGDWARGLVGQWEAHNTIGAVSYPKSCSDQLKITPIRKYIGHRLHVDYGTPEPNLRKTEYYDFVAQYGKIRMLLGIAAGEESRIGGYEAYVAKRDGTTPTVISLIDTVTDLETDPDCDDPAYVQRCIENVYPLVDIGWGRAECQEYMRSVGLPVPPPSNCIFCPFKSYQEILWTKRNLPERWEQWVALEAAKIAAWAGKTNKKGQPVANHGVKGTKTLPEFLAIAEQKFGHLSDAELEDHYMTHGHNVKTSWGRKPAAA